MTLITLREGDLIARINPRNQQLCSLEHGGREYLHGGGKPDELKSAEDRLGWPNTEIIMFPIVGPAPGGVLRIGEEEYSLGQHGIVRHMQGKLVTSTDRHIVFRYEYSGEPVQNTKDPSLTCRWMPFTLDKTFVLEQNQLHALIEVRNTGTTPMPYMLGWHPAFRTRGDERFVAESRQYSLAHVKEASSSAKKALYVHADSISYERDGITVVVNSDLGKAMLWSPDAPLACIEPVSAFQHEHLDTAALPLIQPGQRVRHEITLYFR